MKTNKILFLDNDGVICLSNNWGGRTKKWNEYRKLNPDQDMLELAPVEVRFDDFDKKAVKVLNTKVLQWLLPKHQECLWKMII